MTTITYVFLFLFVGSTWQARLLPKHHLEIDDWELIGSRTYSWKGSEVLRCKHWDKVAIRWHLSTCDGHSGNCVGGSNVDYATRAQNSTEMAVWQNAFTYVQLPEQHKNSTYLRLGLTGYDQRKTLVKSISPLKIDVDWRWQIDASTSCNTFVVRMSAMSRIDKKRREELEHFCRVFDKDRFVDCSNL